MAPTKCKVAVLGAAGGIGQPLSLLLKQNPHITELSLFDVVPVVKGVAVDISHVSTASVVKGYSRDDDGLKQALEGADVVVIPAGVPRKPGMTRDDLFKINAGIVRDLATAIAQHCPKALIGCISNPVNSTVPIIAEVLKKAGVFDARKLFGISTLDVVRAQTFAAEVLQKPLEAATFKVPVVGGHSGRTILPLLSQAQPSLSSVSQSDIEALTNRIQFGGDEVVKAKDGAGSATLSMAYAGYRFVERLIEAKWVGKSGIVEMGYVCLTGDIEGSADVRETVGEGVDYFAVPIELGSEGAAKLLPIGKLSEYEQKLFKDVVADLKTNITTGVSFVDAKL